MEGPGRLLASGRDCDIFDHGHGVVLRRSREGRSQAIEARTMAYAREHGYPVPAVKDLSDDGIDMVIERIDGVSMVEAMTRRPWTVGQQGLVLADLHRRLHELPAPDWVPLAPCGSGDRLVHLDLHPLNVMISDRGPVVIDWSNAARGDGDVDVAVAWILMAAGGIPVGRVKAAMLGWARGVLVRSFLRHSDRRAAGQHLRQAVEWKVSDPHMTDAERRVMWKLVVREQP